jgi:hypothetical protein
VPSQPLEPHSGSNHGVSPLPARPYSRGSSVQQPSILSTSLITREDLVGSDQSAVRALQRGLTTSPLERVQERATSYLDRITAGMRAEVSIVDGTAPPIFQHQVTDVDALQARLGGQGWQAAMHLRPSHGQHPWNNAPQTQHRNVPTARAAQRSSENMPVGTSSQEDRIDRTMQAQPRRLAFRPRPNPPSTGANM